MLVERYCMLPRRFQNGVAEMAKRTRSDIDQITEQLREIHVESLNVDEAVSAISIEIFGSTTRSYIDKLIIVSVLGSAISTIAELKGFKLGGLEINSEVVWAPYAGIALAIAYYLVSAAVLARVDLSRWTATFNLKALKAEQAASEVEELRARLANLSQILSTDLEYDETEPSDVAAAKRTRSELTKVTSQSALTEALLSSIEPKIKLLKSNKRLQIVVFLLFPGILSLVSFVLLVYAIVNLDNPQAPQAAYFL